MEFSPATNISAQMRFDKTTGLRRRSQTARQSAIPMDGFRAYVVFAVYIAGQGLVCLSHFINCNCV
jgi:hypothetical protein